MTPDEPGIRCAREGSVAWLTIDQPDRRNALDSAMVEQLSSLFVTLGDDDAVAAIVVTGAGDLAFCAGMDLKEHAARDADGLPFERPMTGLRRNLYEIVLETPKPTVAVLNGPAIGAGAEIALACDLRFAADHAWMQLPEARRGLGANFAAVLLPRLVPRAVALELLYTGRPIDPARAVALGLFNAAVPGGELATAAREVVDAIAGNAPLTVRRCKHVALAGWELPVSAALRLDVGPDPYRSADRIEGARAFLEKREPRWTGT